jgi:Protein of unknown function (DUF3631)
MTATAAELLPVLRTLFRERGVDRLPTDEVVAALGERLGRPITANRLARTLKPHGVAPRQFRIQGRRAWGYCLRDLVERRDADPPVERRDTDRLDAEREWATRVAMAAAMAHRGGR